MRRIKFKNKVKWLLVLLITIYACNDILVTDISKSSVVLNTPYDSVSYDDVEVTFWFDYIEGADGYNLQVVTPNFNFPEQIILDTNLVENKFTFEFYPDTFECRIYAYNSAYSTNLFTYALFTIKDTVDYSKNFEIEITEPVNNLTTNKTELTFRWETGELPLQYDFIIKSNDWEGSHITDQRGIASDSITVILNEGPYAWGVRAVGANGSKSDFRVRNILIDTTSPGVPEIIFPLQGDSIKGDQVNITWNQNGGSSGSHVSDSLFFADNENFNNVTTYFSENENYQLSDISVGAYYYKIKSYDLAGNQSSFTNTQIFYIVDTVEYDKPGKPVLIAPADSAEISTFPFDLSWERGAENGLILYDSLFIASDSIFNPAQKYSVNRESFSIDTLETGFYYWKVKTNDTNGKSGEFSNSWVFEIK